MKMNPSGTLPYLDTLETQLAGKQWICGDDFTQKLAVVEVAA